MRWTVEKLSEDFQHCQKVVEDYTSVCSAVSDLENSIKAHYVKNKHRVG
jgi:ribosomal protein S17E